MKENNFKNLRTKMEELTIKEFNQLQIEASDFRNAIKRGVYKELHKKHMLTTQQLNELLAQAK